MLLQSNTYCDFAVQLFAVLWAELTHSIENEPQTLCLTVQGLYKAVRGDQEATSGVVAVGPSTLIHTNGVLMMQLLL